jgi:hypothetical protein
MSDLRWAAFSANGWVVLPARSSIGSEEWAEGVDEWVGE